MEPHRQRILIVDDERIIRELLHRILEAEGFSPIVAQNGETALEMIRVGLPDLVISDIKMAGMDGLELLRVVKQGYSELPVILMTAWGGVDGAVQALKEGANDYLTKPIVPEKLVSAVRKAFEEHPRRPLERAEGTALPLPAIQRLRELMGPSTAVETIIDDVALVSPLDFSVIILGETGTGKELIARAIHGAGPRRAAPLVAVDCGAIPETLFESELFGHEKGAFTGATGRKPGKFEIAEEGTLFLDEIANLPLGSQTKLLRAIQEKSFFRVGATVPTQVDVRLSWRPMPISSTLSEKGRLAPIFSLDSASSPSRYLR